MSTSWDEQYEADCVARRHAALAWLTKRQWLVADAEVAISYRGDIRLITYQPAELLVRALMADRSPERDHTTDGGRTFTCWSTVRDGITVELVQAMNAVAS